MKKTGPYTNDENKQYIRENSVNDDLILKERPGWALGPCWKWTGKSIGKYASIRGNRGEGGLGHRLSYKVFNGPIPEGFEVCHHCDHRDCVKPEHLFVGTSKDNTQDAKSKGRLKGWPRGKKHTPNRRCSTCDEPGHMKNNPRFHPH